MACTAFDRLIDLHGVTARIVLDDLEPTVHDSWRLDVITADPLKLERTSGVP